MLSKEFILSSEKLISLISNINEENIDSSVNEFMDTICKACDKCLKKIKSTNARSNFEVQNKWWINNPHLEIMREELSRKKRQAYRCADNDKRIELYDEYYDYQNLYKSRITEAKRNDWREFLAESSKESPWGVTYAIAKHKIKKRGITEIIGDNGQIINGREDILKYLLNKLFPSDSDIPDNYKNINIKDKLKALNESVEFHGQNDLEFTDLEVNEVIKQQNEKKSPGYDGITADIIKCLNESNPHLLVKLFNKCLKIKKFPKTWKRAIVKIIPKADKDDYRNANSYRPISLLPVIGKMYEKLIINRIVDFLRKNNRLSKSQFGFTPQVSTEMALHCVKNFIKFTFDNKGFGMIISLDISGAFNTCYWPKILLQLRKKRCPDNLFKVIESYLSERQAELWLLNSNCKKNLSMGCPQGSAVGPWLFNIAIDDIFDLQEDNVKIQAFADDILIMIYSEELNIAESKANRILNEISKWGEANKMQFNESKTNCLLITHKLNHRDPKILFNGTELELKGSFKYLGLIIDRSLSWRPHCQYLKEKLQKLTNSLIQFTRNKYGLNEISLEIIIKGCVLPIISYCVSVFTEALDKKFFINPLITLQRLLVLRVIKAYRTTSINATNVIGNFMPIDLFLKGRAAEYFAKKNIRNSITDIYIDQRKIALESIVRPVSVLELPHYGKRKLIKTTNRESENFFIIGYNKSNSSIGLSFGHFENNCLKLIQKFKISKSCSQFYSELYIITKVINYIENNMQNTETTIITKSKSIIYAIRDFSSTHKLISKINKSLSEKNLNTAIMIFNNNFSDHFETVKIKAIESSNSHSRIEDKAVSFSFIKKLILKKNLEIWNENWRLSETGMKTKEIFKTVYDRRKLFNFETNYYLTQLFTGQQYR